MSTALVTTTIHVPRILELMRKYDDDVRFFVALDQKSEDLKNWIIEGYSVSNAAIFSPVEQEKWKCSEIIGWNTTSRRNIALLEAIKWGAEIIIYWDDDNLPMSGLYFYTFENLLGDDKFDGLQVSSINGWYNQYGSLFKHRGFPTQTQVTHPMLSHVVDAKVGAAAGLCLGNPDIDAYARMAEQHQVGGVGEVENAGYLVAFDTRCVFNSQNTAFLRKFAPAMFLAPGIGRADDIFASLLTQRIMRDQDYQVHIGPPFTYQERNPHDPLIDLKNEMFCYEHVLEVADYLDRMTLAPDVITSCRYFWGGCSIFPQQTVEAALAFLEDVEGLMK